MYRVDNLIEFLSAVTASCIIALSLHRKTFLVLILIFMIRGAIYIWVRYRIARKFTRL